MDATLVRKPSALLPVALSAAALAIVVSHAVRFGTAPQADEGTAAHLWQILIAAQLPAIGVFAAKWLPARPAAAAVVLGLQALSLAAAMFPVWWFGW
jgi:hypothetical protein